MTLVSSQLSSVDYERHRSYEIRLQNYRSVSTLRRQRTDLGTHAGNCAYMQVPMLKIGAQQLIGS